MMLKNTLHPGCRKLPHLHGRQHAHAAGCREHQVAHGKGVEVQQVLRVGLEDVTKVHLLRRPALIDGVCGWWVAWRDYAYKARACNAALR